MKSNLREHFGDLDIDWRTTKVISECQEIGHNKRNVPDDIFFNDFLKF
jgi:hypothetical protein